MAIKPWVGGNWKCNGTQESIKKLVDVLNASGHDFKAVDVAVCPTPIYVPYVQSVINKDKFTVCSQNSSKTACGAFTGEIAVSQLKDMDINWTLVGHSERRQYYGETDAVLAEKTKIAQESGMCVVLCIGETIDERKGNQTEAVLERQMKALIPAVKDWDKVVVAYEPVWAIGTGEVATPAQAQSAHDFIRKLVTKEVSADVANKLRIVYGGSVNEKNCAELWKQPDINGFLVGGASLKPAFVDIIASVTKPKN